MKKEKELSPEDKMGELVSLCKRRGFVFQSSEIYGGLAGFWDYGPQGVILKKKISDHWWESLVYRRDDVVGLDSSIIAHPRVWEASGHVECFHDLMVDCKECKKRFRTDQISGDKCPECGGELTPPRQFNLMFQTHIGPSSDTQSLSYLRPETAQSIFTNFKNILASSRQKLPFGVAQIGKAFRNEVTPRNFIFRSREFDQMEMEYFINAQESKKWFDYWVQERFNWYIELGIKKEMLRLRPHSKDELAHYARECVDVEYNFPFGWQELEGIADRGDFDLKQHINCSKKDLSYYDDETKERFIPAVIETSAGVDRTFLTVLVDAFHVEELENGEVRNLLSLNPKLAPVEVAVFPLVKKLREPTIKLERELKKEFRTFYDEKGAIGRLYRRQDEIGTPFCVTFDFQSLEDNAVTVRDRDTMLQDRVTVDKLKDYLGERLK
ncbi:MAG: glycine--tRNA ligase [Candidatus Aminicenantes bacterium]|nr:glycine--tRNA ligase [Candidatus Aminicenantes bacterium]